MTSSDNKICIRISWASLSCHKHDGLSCHKHDGLLKEDLSYESLKSILD